MDTDCIHPSYVLAACLGYSAKLEFQETCQMPSSHCYEKCGDSHHGGAPCLPLSPMQGLDCYPCHRCTSQPMHAGPRPLTIHLRPASRAAAGLFLRVGNV